MISTHLAEGDRVVITAGQYKNTDARAIVRSTTRCYVSVRLEQGNVVSVRKSSVEKVWMTAAQELHHEVEALKLKLAAKEQQLRVAIAIEAEAEAPLERTEQVRTQPQPPHRNRDRTTGQAPAPAPTAIHRPTAVAGPRNVDSFVAGDRVKIIRDRRGGSSRPAAEGTVERVTRCFVWVKVDGCSTLVQKANSSVSRLQEHVVSQVERERVGNESTSSRR
jgi:ribosomal protein L24